MNPEEHLASVVLGLENVGISCLIMGGHAVRFYGLQRFTNDFDFAVAPECWDGLVNRLSATGLFSGGSPKEGNSWRPGAFRRFLLGTLADGREEWLEFWKENHLLDAFPALFARRETGAYGGRELAFLSLPDLIRSKETERAKDWDDLAYLEEFLDARLHAQFAAGKIDLTEALANLRSRRGFDTLIAEGCLENHPAVRKALGRVNNPITQALLLPYTPEISVSSSLLAMEPIVEQKLRTVAPASPLHRSLVEVVRRQYKMFRQDQDRANKEAIRASQKEGMV